MSSPKTPVDPAVVGAAIGHGSNASVFLDLGGAGVALASLVEGGPAWRAEDATTGCRRRVLTRLPRDCQNSVALKSGIIAP